MDPATTVLLAIFGGVGGTLLWEGLLGPWLLLAITELPIRRAELIRPSAETVARFVQREFPSLSELLP